MLEKGQNWELFGYDMRQLGSHWVAAWRDLFWADDSPVRTRLDDVVQLRDEGSTVLYQAGQVTQAAPFDCEAILLPDDLILARSLQLPLSAEAYLDSALALEASANSPFSPEDTGYGWRLARRSESRLEVSLVIVSISTVMAFLGREYDVHQPQAQEIWARVNEGLVLVRGFGENKREGKYRKRLLRCGVGLGVCALLLLLVAGTSVVAKRAELLQMQEIAAVTGREAAAASAIRSTLALANETVSAVNSILALHPNPHLEIARLTALLDDDASIVQFAMNGNEIRLRGRAVDASSVMQVLTDEPAYGEVSAPQAIVKVGNTGLEQFSLNITLREGESG